jgi:hypothetical protein
MNKNIQIVVAKYNENTDYLNKEPFIKYSQIVYDKGCKYKDITIYAPDTQRRWTYLENEGRESHTYLYHIIKNYDNLADVTIFLPGSCLSELKKWQTNKTIQLVEESRKSVFVSSELVGDVKDHAYNWCIDDYDGIVKENHIDGRNSIKKNKITIADIRPFGKWFEYEFGDLHTHILCYRGIFALSREHIRQHSKKYYKDLIKYLSGSPNPEYGHYFERAWLAIFYPIPNSCVY